MWCFYDPVTSFSRYILHRPLYKRDKRTSETFSALHVGEKYMLLKMRGDAGKMMLELGDHLKTDERKSTSYTMSHGLLGFINAKGCGYWYYQLIQEAIG